MCHHSVTKWNQAGYSAPLRDVRRTILDAECPPAPLRDTAGCSPDEIAPVTCSDLADPSPEDFSPATLRTLAETYPACGFSRRCLPRFAHRPSDLMALASSLSAHRGFCVSFVKPLSQPASSHPGALITEYFLIVVSAPVLSPDGALVRPGAVLLVSCRAGDWGWLFLATHATDADR